MGRLGRSSAPLLFLGSLVAATCSVACGLTGRHALGPTVDTAGRVGIMYTVSVGPMLRCDRDLAVPAYVGLGAKSADLNGSQLSYELGAGAEWIPATARRGDSSTGPTRLGKRLGLRAGYLVHGDTTALTLGLRGALTIPTRRRFMSFGLEAGCEGLALTLEEREESPTARCQLALLLDFSNPEALGAGPFY